MQLNKTILISCVSKKLAIAPNHVVAAQELYCSTWFNLARRYAKQQSSEWFILSAKYGLLKPGEKIGIYNETLLKQPKSKRLEWTNHVYGQISATISTDQSLEILAGERYREFLVPQLAQSGYKEIIIPMKGMGIGQQQQWLKQQIPIFDLQQRALSPRLDQ